MKQEELQGSELKMKAKQDSFLFDKKKILLLLEHTVIFIFETLHLVQRRVQ
jgi:hypothetical protein